MKKTTSLLLSSIKIAAVVYLLTGLLLYIFQEKLLFYPAGTDNPALSEIQNRYQHVKELQITSNDGKNLHGWVVDNSVENEAPAGIIFYFGGNAEEVSHWIDKVQELENWVVVLTNYRGYGLSEGSPGQKMLFDDALKIFDHFDSDEKYKGIKKISMGWSLGTGVAVHLAYKREIHGVFLISPYDSITEIAVKNYPFFPVKLMIKHPFDSASKAPKINVPVRIIATSGDRIIPSENSERLAYVWGGDKNILIVENYRHNTLISSSAFKKYFTESFDFFKRVPQ
ncbi:MAG: alpha/beta hydrolase [bacterium]